MRSISKKRGRSERYEAQMRFRRLGMSIRFVISLCLSYIGIKTSCLSTGKTTGWLKVASEGRRPDGRGSAQIRADKPYDKVSSAGNGPGIRGRPGPPPTVSVTDSKEKSKEF